MSACAPGAPGERSREQEPAEPLLARVFRGIPRGPPAAAARPEPGLSLVRPPAAAGCIGLLLAAIAAP